MCCMNKILTGRAVRLIDQPSRRRDCHFGGILSPSALKRLLKGEEGRSRMTVSPTARPAPPQSRRCPRCCLRSSSPCGTQVESSVKSAVPCRHRTRPTGGSYSQRARGPTQLGGGRQSPCHALACARRPVVVGICGGGCDGSGGSRSHPVYRVRVDRDGVRPNTDQHLLQHGFFGCCAAVGAGARGWETRTARCWSRCSVSSISAASCGGGGRQAVSW